VKKDRDTSVAGSKNSAAGIVARIDESVLETPRAAARSLGLSCAAESGRIWTAKRSPEDHRERIGPHCDCLAKFVGILTHASMIYDYSSSPENVGPRSCDGQSLEEAELHTAGQFTALPHRKDPNVGVSISDEPF